jgi:hypothetical protein
MILKGTVSPDDVLRGKRGLAHSCPVKLCMQRSLPMCLKHLEVGVGIWDIAIGSHSFKLTRDVGAAICSYDNGGEFRVGLEVAIDVGDTFKKYESFGKLI